MPPEIDAPDIADEDTLWRRVFKTMIHLDEGKETLQSWAFKDSERELSIYLARETTEAAVLALGTPDQRIVCIKAGSIRAKGYKIVRDPEPDNIAHCLVMPYPQPKAHRKHMAEAAWW